MKQRKQGGTVVGIRLEKWAVLKAKNTWVLLDIIIEILMGHLVIVNLIKFGISSNIGARQFFVY